MQNPRYSLIFPRTTEYRGTQLIYEQGPLSSALIMSATAQRCSMRLIMGVLHLWLFLSSFQEQAVSRSAMISNGCVATHSLSSSIRSIQGMETPSKSSGSETSTSSQNSTTRRGFLPSTIT